MLKQLLGTRIGSADADDDSPDLRRTLGVWSLVSIGIGAVIGGGIFVITGIAAAEHAGPAVVLSFALAAICCGFTALCYAEFAAMIPLSGSSYSYAYATLGELVAWFIGWNLVLEYGVSGSAVAVSWTGYLLSLLDHVGIHLPAALVNAPLAFENGHLVTTGAFINLPAVLLILALTWLCCMGIRASNGVNMAIVILKVGLIVLVIAAGWRYVDPSNWTPFIPTAQADGVFGWSGVFHGAAMVFFAYIGFETMSVAAQESRRPQRDLPIALITTLALCTVLYIGMSAVMTGLTPFSLLGTREPVVTAIAGHPQLAWLRIIVEVGALLGLSSVVLVIILAQPRIFMVMGRDGLLPPMFARIHPRYRTPLRNTAITGAGIALLAAVFPLGILGSLVSMGTLIIFITVCIGVWVLRHTRPDLPRTFRVKGLPVIASCAIFSCLFLLAQMGWYSWMLMGIWTLIGLAIYAAYGYRHSHLRRQQP